MSRETRGGLTLGRFVPRAGGGSAMEMAERVARLEWYLGRLSEELEMVLGGSGVVASDWSGRAAASPVGAANAEVDAAHVADTQTNDADMTDGEVSR